MDGIKVVLLDVDNTLLDFNLCAKKSIIKTFSKWGIAYNESVFSAFLHVNRYLWEEIEKKNLIKEEIYALRWKMIFERVGMEGPESVLVDADFRSFMEDVAEPVEGAFELISYLAEKYTVCISSNATYNRQVKRLTMANMMQYVTLLFSSEKIGHMKPAKEFFDACLSELPSVKPEEVVVIGDSLTADVQGGNAAGMKTIWYNHDKINNNTEIVPTYTVDTLLEIRSLL